MADKCYYCEHDINDRPHYVTFYTTEEEHDEPLCDTCYAEWLESLKG
ncbi:hypothetical protein [Alicyclobacillus dauci]|uniref:Small CPxCG-related zinc finger protein n=1 Tax=Alicyclobacillus dauci TaxID=1475485 RepID=A0ABY6Z0D9_9BACL|nr:hypothetical protein [Alicyclobacillus dauci]WAH36220.1 hypothetical protein NZD86_18545 [Alicyclobacillus dauci]